jgi:hypothetical protein
VPSLDGPDVVGVFQEELLLFEPGNELARRIWTGSFADFGRVVNERDLRTGMWVLRCWINPPDPNAMPGIVHVRGRPVRRDES